MCDVGPSVKLQQSLSGLCVCKSSCKLKATSVAMDALAAAIAKKRKSTADEFKGRKFVKRSELEEMRIRKLRDEEDSERQQRVRPMHACSSRICMSAFQYFSGAAAKVALLSLLSAAGSSLSHDTLHLHRRRPSCRRSSLRRSRSRKPRSGAATPWRQLTQLRRSSCCRCRRCCAACVRWSSPSPSSARSVKCVDNVDNVGAD